MLTDIPNNVYLNSRQIKLNTVSKVLGGIKQLKQTFSKEDQSSQTINHFNTLREISI